MKAFRYRALDPQGRVLAGVGYAPESAVLRDQLIEGRLHPISIRPVLFQSARRLTLNEADAARVARDLGQLISSGLSVVQALGVMDSRESPRIAAVLREIRAKVSEGAPLSHAFGAAEGRPARFLQALARAGEASGRQAEVLAAGSASLSAADTLKKRLVTLGLYPAFVILIAIFSIGVYAYAVLPSLEPAFETLGDQIPPQTRTVLMFGAVVRAVIPGTALIAGALAIILTLSARARAWASDRTARLVMRPKRSPLRDFVFAGLASRLSVMLGAGVPLAAAWKLAREPVGMRPVVAALAAQDDRLMEGARLSQALAASGLAPADLLHYVALGEQSGQVPRTLADAATMLGGRSQEAVERVLSILTPLVIVVVGALVGLITLMVFQGLLAVGDAVGA